jgi:hypothetical protein
MSLRRAWGNRRRGCTTRLFARTLPILGGRKGRPSELARRPTVSPAYVADEDGRELWDLKRDW